MNKTFWNWVKNEEGRTLYLDGAIAEETWFGDEVTPKQFKAELISGSGDITVWINSPGGCVFAASQIYNMLMDYKGKVTVKIDGIAASAASVIAMAGGEVLMSPVSMIMLHNPMTIAFGDTEEMEKAIGMLSEVKESIINAYELKTGLSRVKLSHLMDAESWFNAKKAVELGFADKIMFWDADVSAPVNEGAIFSKMAVINSLMSKLPRKEKTLGKPISELDTRLELLKL
ncbi:MAG: ATP-dependent Clp protease proteolytic subunit [Syntrophomonadaceae bacterium]|nr:ATP-dependent Clp protease proteolytic subunit [Bacillota bacterium]MCL5982376.1 Clp protease ClpP [Bacillota bacterium]